VPYFAIENFAAGLDLRRSSLTAPAGTLRVLRNAHITPGGEIEKRYEFTYLQTLGSISRGLAELNNQVYTFVPGGPGISPPPAEFTVGTHGLATNALQYILDYDKFDKKFYVAAAVGDNATYGYAHFFNGAKVSIPNTAPRGAYVRTYKSKMFGTQGTVLYFSSVGNPADWAGTGAGSIDMSLEDSDMSNTLALEAYYDKLAVFSDTAVQLWTIDPDPLLTQFNQTLRQAGTIAPQSVLQYGSGDILYLAPDGIRSLRARNSSLAASVSDVGSPLDPVFQNLYRTMGQGWMGNAISILQPVSGRFWIILNDRIYVLSAFPGPKVTAWSEYVLQTGRSIVAATVCNQRLYVRDDLHNVYVYGGTNAAAPVFDSSAVEVVLPFHGGDRPETYKKFHGIDAVATGEWDVYASIDPSTEAEDYLGKITGPTQLVGRFPMLGYSTHLSLRFRSAKPGPQTISNITVHYDLAQAS